MTNDIIADLLTRIRNAVERKSLSVVAPTTRMVKEISKILKEENYITDFADDGKQVTIDLKYIANKSAIMHLERVSKPGLRSYMGYTDIPRVLNGMGISILSTSKGIMTGKKARLEKVGGEFLCKIW
jgi:small subunit ribosomal protein S8